jgi:hypothetical protein
MHLAPSGTPDVVGFSLSGGRFVGIEIKVAGNKTAKDRAVAQRSFQQEIATAGGISGQVETIAEAIELVRTALGRAA